MTLGNLGSCYVCGSSDLADGHDPRNPTCALDLAARAHVVSMRRAADGDSLAVCGCGWENRVPWVGRHDDQDAAVRAHWLEQRSMAEAI